MHLLIPFSSSSAPGCEQALRSLHLPFLEKLLARLTPVDTDTSSPSSLTPPHERALARLLGLAAPDGCIAWAAHEVAQSGRDPGDDAWAWIAPVHWDVGADHINMADPRALGLQEAESRRLLEAMQAFFEEDGIGLEYVTAQRWLARGAIFGNLPSASLDRVVGREISAWMPSVAGLRRLQNEMQMLLYTHPVNDARNERAQPTVNSFWVSGTGRLAKAAVNQRPEGLLIVDALRDAALRDDWAAWAQCWSAVDQRECRSLLESLASGEDAQLTLCGERAALRFETAPGGLLQRLRSRFRHTTLHELQSQL